MGLKISDLLKFKTEVALHHPDDENKPILGPDKKPVVVYLKLIGDDDLEKSHKASRLVSSQFRKELKDKESEVYRDRVQPIIEASRAECIEIIKSSRTSNLDAQARSATVRPDLPDLDEFAVDPDAPTLVEQEALDTAIEKINTDYEAALKDYITVHEKEIDTELEPLSDEEIRKTAEEEIVAIIALAEFFNELMDQKIYRGAFTDKACREKAFESLHDFKDSNASIKQQLINGYLSLELDPEQLKN